MATKTEDILKKIDAEQVIKVYKDRLATEQELGIVMQIQLKGLAEYVKELEEELQDYKNLLDSSGNEDKSAENQPVIDAV